MRFLFITLLLGMAFSLPVHAAPENGELISIIKSSCVKSCVSGRGEQAFCTSYCGCVSGRISTLAKRTDITKILRAKGRQDALIHQCSGETALKFFSKSCRKNCSGADQCGSYCSCLEGKIKGKRKISQVGKFFIQLGKGERKAAKRLKGFEAICSR